MNKQGIIFDLDGTLWDATKEVVPSWDEVFRKHGCGGVTEKDIADNIGKPLEGFAAALLPDMPIDAALKIIHECVDEENRRLSRFGGVLYDGVESTLKALSKKYSLFIVSNCETGYLEAFFTAHGLKKYFTDSLCNGQTGLLKADNIKLILQKHAPSKAFYVGDTALDGAASKEAGLPFVFAAYGFGTAEGADFEIEKFSDLEKIFA